MDKEAWEGTEGQGRVPGGVFLRSEVEMEGRVELGSQSGNAQEWRQGFGFSRSLAASNFNNTQITPKSILDWPQELTGMKGQHVAPQPHHLTPLTDFRRADVS